MTTRYIPPHLRSKDAAASQLYAQSDEDLYTLHELHTYFWGGLAEDAKMYDSTLNSEEKCPNDSDGIIFVKSNLRLLPAIKGSPDATFDCKFAAIKKWTENVAEYNGVVLSPSRDITDPETEPQSQSARAYNRGSISELPDPTPPDEGTPVDHAPIAVFSQYIPWNNRSFKFIGWYKISRLQFLKPNSPSLLHMLKRKWGTIDHCDRALSIDQHQAKWGYSLSYNWAVIKMEKDEQAMRDKGQPNIDRVDYGETHGPGGRKSVNEILAEMRNEDES
ncbi:hypothetical protein PTMSG1_04907 [Pyrenophora teres f. maculata]|nr:hypothetical protein PTMSG1_04907 [Pyrenophora teres f. maculata]